MLLSAVRAGDIFSRKNSKSNSATNSRSPMEIFKKIPLVASLQSLKGVKTIKKVSSFKKEKRLTILKVLLISGTLLGGLKYRNYISQIVSEFFNSQTQTQKPDVSLKSNFNHGQTSGNFQVPNTTEQVLIDPKTETESLVNPFLVSNTTEQVLIDPKTEAESLVNPFLVSNTTEQVLIDPKTEAESLVNPFSVSNTTEQVLIDPKTETESLVNPFLVSNTTEQVLIDPNTEANQIHFSEKIVQQEKLFSNSTLFGTICFANEAPSNSRELYVCLPRIKNSESVNNKFGNASEGALAALKNLTHINTIYKTIYYTIVPGTVTILSAVALKTGLISAVASRVHSAPAVLKISLILTTLVVTNLVITE